MSKEARTLFVMPEDGIAPVADAIEKAQSSLDIKMFLFTEPRLVNAVIAAHLRGVKTRVMLISRMTHYGATIRAVAPSRVFWLDVKHFPELMRRFPALLQRLVEVMSDRVREVTRTDERHDKLMALGKLSAGLAHELNNPAAAARRAAQHLSERLQTLNRLCLTLSHQTLTAEQIAFLIKFQREAAECLTAAPALDPLAESECEEEISDWLEARQIVDGWKLAPTFVRAGCIRKSWGLWPSV